MITIRKITILSFSANNIFVSTIENVEEFCNRACFSFLFLFVKQNQVSQIIIGMDPMLYSNETLLSVFRVSKASVQAFYRSKSKYFYFHLS